MREIGLLLVQSDFICRMLDCYTPLGTINILGNLWAVPSILTRRFVRTLVMRLESVFSPAYRQVSELVPEYGKAGAVKYLVDGVAHFTSNDMTYVDTLCHFGHLCVHDLHDASSAQHDIDTMRLLQSQTMASPLALLHSHGSADRRGSISNKWFVDARGFTLGSKVA